MKIHDLSDILKYNGLTYVEDEGGLEWFDPISGADEDGNFEYEMIQYYKFSDEEYFNLELQVRHDIKFGANQIYLSNPSLEDLITAMEFLNFNKKIELPK